MSPSNTGHAIWVQSLGSTAVSVMDIVDSIIENGPPDISIKNSPPDNLPHSVTGPNLFSSSPSQSTSFATGSDTAELWRRFSNKTQDECQLQTAKSFERSIGSILCTLGMTGKCPIHNCRLDWALIDITSASRFKEAGHGGLSNVSTKFPLSSHEGRDLDRL